jgi:hypothetical protein
MVERIWVKKSAVRVHSTSVLSDGSNGRLSVLRLCILRSGGMPCRMTISIGTASETCAPASRVLRQAMCDMPVMCTNRLSGPMPSLPLSPPMPLASASKGSRMPKGERMCTATCRPSWRPMFQAFS